MPYKLSLKRQNNDTTWEKTMSGRLFEVPVILII